MRCENFTTRNPIKLSPKMLGTMLLARTKKVHNIRRRIEVCRPSNRDNALISGSVNHPKMSQNDSPEVRDQGGGPGARTWDPKFSKF